MKKPAGAESPAPVAKPGPPVPTLPNGAAPPPGPSPAELLSMVENIKYDYVEVKLEDQETPIKVDWSVVTRLPIIYRAVVLQGEGVNGKPPLKLPPQVSSNAWKLVEEYCIFHSLKGRSDKERQMFDEKFIRIESSKLCELTSAAHILDFPPLVDLGSKGIARLIRGKTPEQIRGLFSLPDDLTEEEKLEPMPQAPGAPPDTRIRLLNNLNAKKRQQLQSAKQQQQIETHAAKEPKDDRPIDDLLSFIEESDQQGKSGGKSKSKKKKSKSKSNAAANNTNTTVETEPKPEPSKAANGSTDTTEYTPAAAEARVLSLPVPQMSLIDDFEDVNEDDVDDDAFQEYLLNLALMRQQAPITQLTSLSQFKARANGNGIPAVEEEDVSDSDEDYATDDDDDANIVTLQADADELGSVTNAVAEFFKACGLDRSLLVGRCSGAGELPPMRDTQGVVIKLNLPQAGGSIELKWKPEK